MASDFLIVHKKLLPAHLDKVILARQLLQNHEVTSVTEAVSKVGISRNTYYKYKDLVFTYEEEKYRRKAVLRLVLRHETGSLSSVLSSLSQMHVSVITISQAIPIANQAAVTLTLDLSDLKQKDEDLIQTLKKLTAVISVSFEMVD